MIYPGIFSIVVGVLMISQWTILLASKNVPELKTEPVRILFHIAGEYVTAGLLIFGGIGLLAGAKWGTPIYLFATGMLLYTVIVSPGYYAQKRVWAFVAMFALILILALVGLWSVL